MLQNNMLNVTKSELDLVPFENKTSYYDLDNLPEITRLAYVSSANIDEIIGMRFSHLMVVATAISDKDHPKVTVKCDCGTIKSVSVEKLAHGHIVRKSLRLK